MNLNKELKEVFGMANSRCHGNKETKISESKNYLDSVESGLRNIFKLFFVGLVFFGIVSLVAGFLDFDKFIDITRALLIYFTVAPALPIHFILVSFQGVLPWFVVFGVPLSIFKKYRIRDVFGCGYIFDDRLYVGLSSFIWFVQVFFMARYSWFSATGIPGNGPHFTLAQASRYHAEWYFLWCFVAWYSCYMLFATWGHRFKRWEFYCWYCMVLYCIMWH